MIVEENSSNDLAEGTLVNQTVIWDCKEFLNSVPYLFNIFEPRIVLRLHCSKITSLAY